MKGIDPDIDKVMLCGNMAFNLEIKHILKDRWTEASNRERGSMAIEKAFVG